MEKKIEGGEVKEGGEIKRVEEEWWGEDEMCEKESVVGGVRKEIEY